MLGALPWTAPRRSRASRRQRGPNPTPGDGSRTRKSQEPGCCRRVGRCAKTPRPDPRTLRRAPSSMERVPATSRTANLVLVQSQRALGTRGRGCVRTRHATTQHAPRQSQRRHAQSQDVRTDAAIPSAQTALNRHRTHGAIAAIVRSGNERGHLPLERRKRVSYRHTPCSVIADKGVPNRSVRCSDLMGACFGWRSVDRSAEGGYPRSGTFPPFRQLTFGPCGATRTSFVPA